MVCRGFKYSLILVLLAGMFSLSVQAAATLPFNETFEDINSSDGVSGLNGWLATTAVVATNATAFAGTNSAYIPDTESLTNEATVAVDQNVWIEVYAKVTLEGVGVSGLVPASDVVAQFYFNSDGYPVVLNGSTTNWVILSQTMAGNAFTNVVVEGDWVRLSVFMNYTDETWALFVDGEMLDDDIEFNKSTNKYQGFVVENETYIDNFWMNTERPDGDTSNSLPRLLSDTDGDGMGDAFELDYWGNVTYETGTGDADDDGRSNAEEYNITPDSSDPTSADNSDQSIPYREDFENATLGSSYTNSSGWHAIANTGIMKVVSDTFELQQAMSLSNGFMSVGLSGTNGTNVWIQIYMKPVVPENAAVPVIGAAAVATFYVASGGVLRASSGGVFSNCAENIPADTWLGFVTHLDYTTETWDLYVATNGVFGENLVRANDTPLDFSKSSSHLTNVIIELFADETMYVDVLAVSLAHTNIVPAYSNVVAYDRLVGEARTASMPPYTFASNTVASTPAGDLGEYLLWGMTTNDELVVTVPTNIPQASLYTVANQDGTNYWQGDGAAPAATNIFINKATALTMMKKSGRDEVVFYPYSNYVAEVGSVVILGNAGVSNGWSYTGTPFTNDRVVNHASNGLMLTNLATAGDRIYLRESIRLVFTSDKKWLYGRGESSHVIGKDEKFWYYNLSATSFTWTATGP